MDVDAKKYNLERTFVLLNFWSNDEFIYFLVFTHYIQVLISNLDDWLNMQFCNSFLELLNFILNFDSHLYLPIIRQKILENFYSLSLNIWFSIEFDIFCKSIWKFLCFFLIHFNFYVERYFVFVQWNCTFNLNLTIKIYSHWTFMIMNCWNFRNS